jgi:hypothetical protein
MASKKAAELPIYPEDRGGRAPPPPGGGLPPRSPGVSSAVAGRPSRCSHSSIPPSVYASPLARELAKCCGSTRQLETERTAAAVPHASRRTSSLEEKRDPVLAVSRKPGFGSAECPGGAM